MTTEATDWDSADWQLGNSEIARQLGVTRERVRQKRAELGLPPKAAPSTRDALRNMNVTGRTAASLAIELGVTRETINELANELGLNLVTPAPAPARRHDWDSVNWEQPNRTIARQLGTSASVVKNRRILLRRNGHDIPRSPL